MGVNVWGNARHIQTHPVMARLGKANPWQSRSKCMGLCPMYPSLPVIARHEVPRQSTHIRTMALNRTPSLRACISRRGNPMGKYIKVRRNPHIYPRHCEEAQASAMTGIFGRSV